MKKNRKNIWRVLRKCVPLQRQTKGTAVPQRFDTEFIFFLF